MTQVLVRKRYVSLRRSHTGRLIAPRSDLQPGRITRREWLRFLGKVELGPICQCTGESASHRHWLWGAGLHDGHGHFKWRGRMYHADRFARIALRGALSPGETPYTRCRMRSCCNPACLETVPQREAWRRGEAPSAHNLRKTHCHRGHELSGENLLPYGVRHGMRVCKTCCYDRNASWKSEHLDSMTLYQKTYARAHRKAHPEMTHARLRRRRAAKRGAPINDLTHAQWREIQGAYDHRCVYCGKRRKGKLTQDHVIPLSKGGSHTAMNVIPACGSCNSRKGNRGPLCAVQPLLLTVAQSKPVKRRKRRQTGHQPEERALG